MHQLTRIPLYLRDTITDDPVLLAEFDRGASEALAAGRCNGSAMKAPVCVLPYRYIALPPKPDA